MLTPDQIKIIKIAQKQVGMDGARYRLMLANVGGVKSCRDLDNASFEDCMEILEEMGFSHYGVGGGFYWREKVRRRGQFANERMLHKINELYASYLATPPEGLHGHYAFSRLIRRATNERCESLDKLAPAEAWKLIEMLKAILARTQRKPNPHQNSRTATRHLLSPDF